ncbi:LacI family DNA-binding transcriptional regulator [Cellulomonas sp. 179-A 4D5 NHS]|uniref:LacI family DNA-binding transcriptional regulator n=1 Tax=Cellulomonas sp. 179-A 4D5 NHS TaxID=3142378 RepID=UPI0039A1C14F
MQRRITIKDVAEAAGVSTTTVSLVLNKVPGRRIPEHTRHRVREAAEQLGYAADAAARTLRTQRSQSIGFVSDEIATSPFAGQLIQGAQDVARARDNIVLLTNSGYDRELERREVRALLDRRVDGILYAAMYHRVVELPPELAGVPVVVLNAECPDEGVSWVAPDEFAGGWDAAEVLLAAGHCRLAMVNDADEIPASAERPAGFLARCAEAGIPASDVPVVRSEPRAVAARPVARELLDRPDRPTAVFGFNDQVALGVYLAAADLGLRVPEDLSVIGFDNVELLAESVAPGLTTIALPHHEMGAWAAEQLYVLVDAPDGQAPPRRTAHLRGPVVHRASVTSPPR